VLPRQDLVVALDDADGRMLYGASLPRTGLPRPSPRWTGCYAGVAASWSCIPTAAATSGVPRRGRTRPHRGTERVRNTALQALGIVKILARSPQGRIYYPDNVVNTRYRKNSQAAAEPNEYPASR